MHYMMLKMIINKDPAVLSQDFAIGALVVLSLLVVYKIWALFRSASLSQIQAVANKPVAHVGNDSKITVYGDSKATEETYKKGIPDFSPFVNRVENFLHLIHQPYVKGTTMSMSQNPRHKIPYANIEGTMIDDSGRILELLRKKLQMKEELSEDKKAKGYLLRNLLTNSFYFVLCLALFDAEKGRKYIHKEFKKRIPVFMKPFLPLILASFHQHEHANLYGQGYGRYPEQEILQKGQDDIRTINDVLGRNKFILGTQKPTIYDTDVYSFLCFVFLDKDEGEDNPLAEFNAKAQKENPNLVAYMARLKEILYPHVPGQQIPMHDHGH